MITDMSAIKIFCLLVSGMYCFLSYLFFSVDPKDDRKASFYMLAAIWFAILANAL